MSEKNPVTGRNMGKVEQSAQSSFVQAHARQGTSIDKALAALSFQVSHVDSDPVKEFVGGMLKLVSEHKDRFADLKKVIPEIENLLQRIEKDEAATLSKSEIAHIKQFGHALLDICRTRLSLATRIGRSLSKSVQKLVPDFDGMRGSVAQTLDQTGGVTFKLLAKALAPSEARTAQKARRQQQEQARYDFRAEQTGATHARHLEAVSDMQEEAEKEEAERQKAWRERSDDLRMRGLNKVNAERQRKTEAREERERKAKGLGQAGKGHGKNTEDMLENMFGGMFGPNVQRLGQMAGPAAGTARIAGGGASSEQFKVLITTNKSMLTELKSITKILQNQLDDAREARNDAMEAASEVEQTQTGAKEGGAAVTATGKKEKAGQKSGGLLNTIADLFTSGGGLAGITKVATTVGKALLPAAGAVGSVAAIAGGALAGTEVGRWRERETRKNPNGMESRFYDTLGKGFAWIGDKTGLTNGAYDQYDQSRASQATQAAGQKSQSLKQFVTNDVKRLVGLPVAPDVSAPVAPGAQPSAGTQAPLASHLVGTGVATLPSASGLDVAPGNSPARTSSAAFDYDTFARTMGKRESGDDYRAENKIGYIGKYQFGAQALETFGLIKKGASKLYGGNNKKILNDPTVWTTPGGREAFLRDPALQERLMKQLTSQNMSTLKRLNVITAQSTGEQIAGYLAAAHLIGAGGVKTKGLGGKDAFNTSAQSYYNMASAAQLNLPSQNRDAQAVASMTATNRPAATIVAPQTIVAQNGGAASHTTTIVPMPINSENPDATLRAIRSASTL